MVLVIQSHCSPLPAPWYEACIASVRRYAACQGFEYRWLGDELLTLLPPALIGKTRQQPVVATDLARLIALEAALEAGAEQVVWIDADVLVLDPTRLGLSDTGAQFGREVWVQPDDRGGFRAYRRIHNAFMAFRAGNPVLPFYRFAAERVLERFDSGKATMVPQLIGPKLLAVLHNAIGLDVLESAGMLSPSVATDLLTGGGPALERFRSLCEREVLAVNLCGSSVRSGALDDIQMARLVSLLIEQPELLGR